MLAFHTITMPDGQRLVVNLLDVVSMQEVRTAVDCGTEFGVAIRLRNGDNYLIKDARRELVDDLLVAARGWPDPEAYTE